VRFRLIVLALQTFAIGTGSFVFAGLLEGVARDLSISVGAAGEPYARRALQLCWERLPFVSLCSS